MKWKLIKAAWQEFAQSGARGDPLRYPDRRKSFDRDFLGDLPALTGTPKQVEYAPKYRTETIDDCLFASSGYDEACDSVLWDWAISHTDAGFWIRNFNRTSLKSVGFGAIKDAVDEAPSTEKEWLREAIKQYRNQNDSSAKSTV